MLAKSGYFEMITLSAATRACVQVCANGLPPRVPLRFNGLTHPKRLDYAAIDRRAFFGCGAGFCWFLSYNFATSLLSIPSAFQMSLAALLPSSVLIIRRRTDSPETRNEPIPSTSEATESEKLRPSYNLIGWLVDVRRRLVSGNTRR